MSEVVIECGENTKSPVNNVELFHKKIMKDAKKQQKVL